MRRNPSAGRGGLSAEVTEEGEGKWESGHSRKRESLYCSVRLGPKIRCEVVADTEGYSRETLHFAQSASGRTSRGMSLSRGTCVKGDKVTSSSTRT